MPIVGTNELAKLANCTRQRITQYHHEGMPRVKRGKWDTELCLEWILAYRAEAAALSNTPPDITPLADCEPEPEVQPEPEDDSQGMAFAEQRVATRQAVATLAEARLRYVTAQAAGQEKRNAILDGATVVTERVVTAIRERDSHIIAAGTQWVSRATTGPDRALRTELWNELRRTIAATIESVAADLSSGDTVGATRIRHARRVGRS